MSYFDLPRLYFSGTFRASPSTINNVDSNFAEPPILQKLWNPKGSHDFQILRGNEFTIPPSITVKPCTIQSIATSSGFVTDDPLLGQMVISTNSPAVAKLVDLDPDQQQVSQIWGMQLSIGDPNGERLVADYEPAYFQQIFTARAPGGFAAGFSAAYQSMLVNLQWPDYPASHVLQELRSISPDGLSIRFTVDRLDAKPTLPNGAPNPNFTLGRVTGTIGPASAGEPSHITVGRMLRPGSQVQLAPKSGAAKESLTADAPPAEMVNTNFNLAPAKVDTQRGVVAIDLGNGLPFNADGTPANAGTLQLAFQTASGFDILGTIDNTLDNYLKRAFLFEFALGGSGTNNPLVVLSDGNVVLTENASGAWIDAAEHVYRMDASTDATVTLYSAVFGDPPPAGQSVDLTVQPMGSGTNVQPLIVTPQTVTLGHDGTATFTMSSGSPGNPRGPINGQVYAVSFTWNEDTNPDPSAFVSVHVYDALTVPATPTWTDDIFPIFQQIMVLYPFMQTILDLSDEATVAANAAIIAGFMRLPMTNPHFMPVTRDLSGPQTEMILKWLDAQGGA
jgi:hypothetical protein